jgi:hypothetical protein
LNYVEGTVPASKKKIIPHQQSQRIIARRVIIGFFLCKKLMEQATTKICGQNIELLQVSKVVVHRVTIGILRGN